MVHSPKRQKNKGPSTYNLEKTLHQPQGVKIRTNRNASLLKQSASSIPSKACFLNAALIQCSTWNTWCSFGLGFSFEREEIFMLLYIPPRTEPRSKVEEPIFLRDERMKHVSETLYNRWTIWVICGEIEAEFQNGVGVISLQS
jgi:hypothetical protein